MNGDGAAGAAENVLVACVRQGDRDAAALLMQRHNRGLWRIARGILGNEADAEEVVQEAYVRAFTSLHEFRGDASLSTWLARIVINEALRHLSRRRPMSDLAAVDENAADHLRIEMPPPSPEQEAARNQIRRMVEQAVDTLPASFRAVFIMRVVEQMSIDETASVLRIPAATVKTRLHRATQQLRQVLGAEFAAAIEGTFPFDGARCARLTAIVLSRLGQVRAAEISLDAGPPAPSTTTQKET